MSNYWNLLRRIDAFELWYWRRLLRVPWTTRRSNQSILKEISPGCSLEGIMLKLKLQYFGHLMWKVDSLEKTLMLGGIGDRSRRGWQRMTWLDGITDLMDVGLGELWDGQGGLACCNSWGRKIRTWLSDWTELNWTENLYNKGNSTGDVLLFVSSSGWQCIDWDCFLLCECQSPWQSKLMSGTCIPKRKTTMAEQMWGLPLVKVKVAQSYPTLCDPRPHRL